MTALLIICVALAPPVVLASIMIRRDNTEPEPRKWLIGSACLGIAAALASIISVMLTLPDFEVDRFSTAIVNAFCRAAIPEECFKLLMLFIVAKCCESFNEIFDGIIYAVCIAMGFAGFENILYLFDAGSGWLLTGILRALISVPGHYFFAILMGAFFSLAWFDPRHRTRNAFLALALPVTAHGIFDSLLMATPIDPAIGFCLIVVFFVFLRRLRKYASRLVAERLEMDQSRTV